MKKFAAILLICALLLTALAGCVVEDTATDTSADTSTDTTTDTATDRADTATENVDDVASTSSEKDFSGITLNFAQDLGTNDVANATTEKIIQAYEEATGITIEFNNVSDSYRTWLATQFSANQGPDVYSGILYDMTSDYESGLLYNFADLYESESAYDTGKPWKDTLPESILERMYLTDGSVPGYPTTSQVVRIFYNVDMMEDAGCEIPTTWEEFMDVCQKLSDAGYTPFGFANASHQDLCWLWFCNSISNQLNEELLHTIDVSGNGYAELNEIVKAFEEGALDFSSPQFQECFTLMKDFSQYWTSDYNGLVSATAYDQFMRGQVAMVQAMSTNMTSFLDGIDGAFEIGVMPVPTITTETSEYAMGQSVVLGGQPDIIYGINAACANDEKKLEAAIDFVQYMSSPEVQMMYCESTDRLPLATSTELPERLEGFIITEDALRAAYYTGVNNEWRDYFARGGQTFLDGSQSLEDYCAYLNEAFASVCEQLMVDNGWSAENNYGLDA